MKTFKLLLTAVAVLAVVSSSMAVKRSQIVLYKRNLANPAAGCIVPSLIVNPGVTFTDPDARLGSPGVICGVVNYNLEN